MSNGDPYVHLDDVMEYVFDPTQDKDTRKDRLEALLNSADPVADMEAVLGKSMHPEHKKHLPHLIKTKTGHRNAMIHSRKTLDYMLDLMKGNSTPPPPWVG